VAILGSCDAFGAEVSGGCGKAVNTIGRSDALVELLVVLPVVLPVVSPGELSATGSSSELPAPDSVGVVLEEELHAVNNSTLAINTILFTGSFIISMLISCCFYLV